MIKCELCWMPFNDIERYQEHMAMHNDLTIDGVMPVKDMTYVNKIEIEEKNVYKVSTGKW